MSIFYFFGGCCNSFTPEGTKVPGGSEWEGTQNFTPPECFRKEDDAWSESCVSLGFLGQSWAWFKHVQSEGVKQIGKLRCPKPYPFGCKTGTIDNGTLFSMYIYIYIRIDDGNGNLPIFKKYISKSSTSSWKLDKIGHARGSINYHVSVDQCRSSTLEVRDFRLPSGSHDDFQAVGLLARCGHPIAALRMASSRANLGTCALAGRSGINYQPTSSK